MSALIWMHDFVKGRERGFAMMIAALAVLACSALVIKDGDTIRSLDEPDFFAIAENLAFNGSFAVEPGQPTAYRAPGLPLFYAPFVRMGAGLMEVRLINAILMGLGLVILFHLVRRHAGPMAGLFAVAMVPAWPVVLYGASTFYPQTQGAFFLVLMLWLIDRLRDAPSVKRTVLAGLAYGALVLTIPITLLMAPIFALWVFLSARKKFLNVAVYAVISACFVCTWTARNYITFDGAFVPIATSSGYNLLLGNTANARWNTSTSVRFPEQVYTDLTGKNEIERNDIMTEAAMAEIKADPKRFLTRYLGKFVHWFHFSNRLVSDEAVENGASSVAVGTRDMILFVSYMLVIALPLLLRLVMIGRIPIRMIEALFIVLWIAAGLAYAMYFTRVRFRLPFDWLLIASNGIFLATLLQYYVERAKTGVARFTLAERRS